MSPFDGLLMFAAGLLIGILLPRRHVRAPSGGSVDVTVTKGQQ